jgi:transposase-like protein
MFAGSTKFNDDLTVKVSQMLGTKHCTNCYQHRKTDGGVYVTMANGRKRWVCKNCSDFYAKRRAS